MKIDYVIAAVVSLGISYFSVVMFMMAGGSAAGWAAAFLVVTYIGALYFISERKTKENVGLGVFALISPPFILWIGLFLFFKIFSLIG